MFAKIIIDSSSKAIDRPFTYRIPGHLEGVIQPGSRVRVPFGKGNTLRDGYCIGIETDTALDPGRVKEIDSLPGTAQPMESQMMELAIWMRYRYGGTLAQAFAAVLPNRKDVKPVRNRLYVWKGTKDQLLDQLYIAERRKYYAKIRLLKAFTERLTLPADLVSDRLQIQASTLKSFTDQGLVAVEYVEPAPMADLKRDPQGAKPLNAEQQAAVREILEDPRQVHLLYGITGSGKTEVYLNVIEAVLASGKEVIVLIPEIALTYQTVMRFYARFGERVSVVHSRLSAGEKSARFRMASEGGIRVMIGPRSALFTPFKNLGLIIVDEFHEPSYLSDQSPKYSAVETAVKRASLAGCKVVLGSATPLVEYYGKALSGAYALSRMRTRAVQGSRLPEVEIADLREEFRKRNRSIFSEPLQKAMEEALMRREQIMLFLNRRGYSGAVSCRSCGEAVGCPHCSVPLNYHKNGTLKCHYCGFSRPMVKQCPACGSGMISTFGIGTEKVEEMVKERFPSARTLRMDADTTGGKDGHRVILEQFNQGEADVLIGTQMIVKGHDFPNVTLVGILAADLSLNVPDYRAAERTFQLLVQAEGRAGRADKPGRCIVQTYLPDHYAVRAAVKQDFDAFYENEMLFRKAMHYPPAGIFSGIRFAGPDEGVLRAAAEQLSKEAADTFGQTVRFLGPAEETAYKVKDQYRMILRMKADALEDLLAVKQYMEGKAEPLVRDKRIYMTFES
ncbi:MAG: primosomal protein N' [Lachnospiraceae bacterium]|nr:primosomal protein N' [Lachnospiraceae bacterium]